jgi:phosphoribosylformylglycinamidine synthase II/phosphoribosylformylglycinamidine synthase I
MDFSNGRIVTEGTEQTIGQPEALSTSFPSHQDNIFRIEVGQRSSENGRTARRPGRNLRQAARELGLTHLQEITRHNLYFLQGKLTGRDVEQLAGELLADPVTETYAIHQLLPGGWQPTGRQLSMALTGTDEAIVADHLIDVTLLPGVTDAAADNLVRAAHLLGLADLERAATGQRYWLWGRLEEPELEELAGGLCANPVIQRFAIDRPIGPPFFPYQAADDAVEIIALRTAGDEQLQQISQERRLALDLAEMRAIGRYYQQEGRDPTDVELETVAQTWSEHCVHKTFKALIHYTGPAGPDGPVESQIINGLLRTYIRAATEKVNKPWVRSAFVDNAGIIAFNDHFDLAFKVETHNHPSALEPFGGANTGVGGVIRDILGVSARPIANTDILCFGPPNLAEEALPAGVLHPRRIADGVIHGIEDYGNKMGIPTVNGAITYDPGYTANPLVYCGCLGLLPRDSHPTQARPGDLIIAIGGRTGRDGLRGATFSSMEMDVSTGDIAGSAVQIGNPIQEKQVLEVVLQARDERLYTAITDCGAGGFSSAVGEMGAELGAWVQLADAPLKYPGLRPWEIWLSEAQERMVLAVPPANWPRLQAICAGQDVEATCIGRFGSDNGPAGPGMPAGDEPRLRLYYGQRRVGDLAMDFLHEGLPQRELTAVFPPAEAEAAPPAPFFPAAEPGRILLALLSQPDIRSKEDVIRRYDHEVQGGTVVRPLVGPAGQGPGDAAVLVPLDQTIASLPADRAAGTPIKGAALANGLCPAYSSLDPYAMAWAAIDEAFRNVVAVGADPEQVALLDNFCWGNPNLPDRLGGLVRCAQGCHDAAVAYNAPFISGKDSLNNEYTGADGRKHAIPGTLLISALAIVPEVNQTVTMDLKQAGNLLYLIGDTGPHLGGSQYQRLTGLGNNQPPQPVPGALDRFRVLHQAIRLGLIQACHDCSEGGLAVTLAEMCLAGGLGADIALDQVPVTSDARPDDETLLFSESLTRLIVEIRPEDVPAFSQLMADAPHGPIGRVVDDGFAVQGQAGQEIMRLSLAEIETAWRGHLGEAAIRRPLGRSNVAPQHSYQFPAVIGDRPRVLILHANGTNRDREAALACTAAGGRPEIVHTNQLLSGQRQLLNYHMLVIPGGFSYGDDLGAGTLWALDLRHRLGQAMHHFADSGRPVLGICNGFQALVKSGLLPGQAPDKAAENGRPAGRPVTLAPNDSAHFECRWVYLRPNPASPCLFTAGLDSPIHCPVAHGEGRLAVRGEATLRDLQAGGLIALTYSSGDDGPAGYPANPNGSALDIAGLCNPAGNVLGLMPHPEDHIFTWQHPHRHRERPGLSGLPLFVNGIRYARR